MSIELSVRFSWRSVGNVRRDEQGKLVFPRVPSRPGLYRFELDGTAGQQIYIGETDTLNRRFQHYRTPGPSQSTNIRLNALLGEILAASGSVSVAIVIDGAVITIGSMEIPPQLDIKSDRVLLEHAAIYAARASGAPLINL